MLRILGSKNIDEINFKSSEMMAVAAGGGSSNEAKDGRSSGRVDDRGFHPEDHGGLAGLPSPSTGSLGRPYQPFPTMGNLDWPYQPSPTGNSGWPYEPPSPPPFPPTGNLVWPYQPSRTGDSCWPYQLPYFPRRRNLDWKYQPSQIGNSDWPYQPLSPPFPPTGNSDRPYQPSRGNSCWPYQLPYFPRRRNWDWNYQPSQTGNSDWPYQPLSPPPFPPTVNSDRPYQRSQTGSSGFQSKQKTRNSDRRYQPFPPVMPVAKGGGPSNNAEDGPTVVMVNGVWVDERFPLRPSYKELIRGVHKCEARTVDFLHKASEVVDEINSWADDASRGLIKDVLKPRSLSSETAIVLGNGLYFKGLWDSDYKFDASRTENRDFYLSSGNIVLVPFMTSHKKYYFGSFEGFNVLRIPYQGRKLNKSFSMYFFLPNEKDGLKNLVEKFNTCPWFLQQNLNLREVPLHEFWIPKFKFSFDFNVSSVMSDMGEPLMFLHNPKDWSDMMHIPEDVPIMIPNMIQKAYIEVDEKGTEAAAITIIGMQCGCACMSPPKTESFVADQGRDIKFSFFHWSSR
ncbi:hypothetical protein RHGRI_019835 [Rhododendron griersonianum]|uniref:Serpin domain-containing protein n=1 Tax=Rhododendron griersonianum TaxID=479676 RepID=A0AAV6JE60_9ERIC|nr:hypothetical protein RHGRI_019835 [Rhododendron griersonianum]